MEFLDHLPQWGFPVNPKIDIGKGIEFLIEYYEKENHAYTLSVRGKNVAVVGPSETILGFGLRKIIDSCDIGYYSINTQLSSTRGSVNINLNSSNSEFEISINHRIRLEKIGVAAITLHPRTTKQQFMGKSNWQLIKDLKKSVKNPVIGRVFYTN